MAATLVEGREYGLASNASTSGNKTFIHFKLTDSALRALEEYSKIKGRCSRKPTIKFTDHNGMMCIPGQVSSDDPKAERRFTLNLSKTHGDANASFDCIQQITTLQGSSLQCQGSMQYKITTLANNDVYTDTRKKIAIADTESKKFCAKEIKMSGRFSGKKIKKVIPSSQYHSLNPAKPSSAPVSRPSPALLPNTSSIPSVAASCRLTPPAGSLSPHHVLNGSRGSSKPQSNGNNPPRSGSHSSSKITSGIVSKPYKDRVIHLLALRPYKKPELIARLMKDGIRDKDKNMLGETLNAVAMMNKDNSYTLSKSAWKMVNPDWEFYTTEGDKQLLKRNQQQMESRFSISPSVSPTVRTSDSPSPPQKRSGGDPGDVIPSKKQRISHHEKQHIHTNGGLMASNKDQQDNSPGYQPSPSYNFVDSGYGASVSPDAGSPGSTGSNRENQVKGNNPDPGVPNYLTQYSKIKSCEQRLRYKEHFNQQYKEYLQLHQKVNNVSSKFAELQESIKKLDEDSREFQELKSRVLKEYEAQKMNEKFFEQRDRVRYLHAKLGHIKRLIMDYDAHQHAQECS